MLKALIFLRQLKSNKKFKIMSLINTTHNNIELRSILISLSTILIYYFFSISLTFYNRYLFVNYKYPLSITVIHLVVKYLIAALIRSIWNIVAAKKQNYKKRITLEWSTYLRKIIPMAIASALDIGLSNWSLQYITVTLYTMSKSTVILFILFFSLLFKLEKWVSDYLNTITVCTILK
jgi:solute carrier family 35 protein C2